MYKGISTESGVNYSKKSENEEAGSQRDNLNIEQTKEDERPEDHMTDSFCSVHKRPTEENTKKTTRNVESSFKFNGKEGDREEKADKSKNKGTGNNNIIQADNENIIANSKDSDRNLVILSTSINLISNSNFVCADNQYGSKETSFFKEGESKVLETQESEKSSSQEEVLATYFDRIGLKQRDIDKLKGLGSNLNKEKKQKKEIVLEDSEEEINEFSGVNSFSCFEKKGSRKINDCQGNSTGIGKRKKIQKRMRSNTDIQGIIGVKLGRKMITKKGKKKINRDEPKICSDSIRDETITESDIRKRKMKIIEEEAKETIDIGKKCGMSVISEEVLIQNLIEVEIADENERECNKEDDQC